MHPYVLWFEQITLKDLEEVGGKNASLGEMIKHLSESGVTVPGGFATTASAFQAFLTHNQLHEKIYKTLDGLDTDDMDALAKTGAQLRQWIMDAPFEAEMEQAVREAYAQLLEKNPGISVAVRSSATAEDLPEASFAGQQETFLNVSGIEAVLVSIKKVFASLFNDRAIAYRVHQGFAHEKVSLSAGIQRMVRSDTGASGVMFSVDTESGFENVVFITSSYGLGEMVVQGAVNPDEFLVYKPALNAGKSAILRRNSGSKHHKMVYSVNDGNNPVVIEKVSEDEQQRFSLTNDDVENLARKAVSIEKHYGKPMDIEWGKDGQDGQLYILQARPETVKSRENKQVLEQYVMHEQGKILTEGRSVGQKVGKGKARVIKNVSEIGRVQAGDVLISDMTDPDWEPVMKKASAIVTNRGGRTCHAAIIARELGIPAVVGCGNATEQIQEGDDVTVSCAEGDTGFVYQGLLDFSVKTIDVNNVPELPLKVMLNVGNPERALAFQSLPNEGVGLARLEFLISNSIGIHPKALLNFDSIQNRVLKDNIAKKIVAYENPVEFYVEKLKEGISTIGAAFAPKPVIVRLSDFKSNEYANLLGGEAYEPSEENPMLGYRGASRYISEDFKDCFALECQAIKRVREEMGLTNVEIMIPFVRTVDEAKLVIEALAENGLERGKDGLRVIMMCELPSNALLAEQFLEHFDGFSIGSNDLTQLTLGLDRDSALVAHYFDERNPAVKALLSMAIRACKKAGKYIGICGQGPSDHPDLAKWLMDEKIDSISLNPDSVLKTYLFLDDLR